MRHKATITRTDLKVEQFKKAKTRKLRNSGDEDNSVLACRLIYNLLLWEEKR